MRVAKEGAPIFISVFGRFGTLALAPAKWPHEIEDHEQILRFARDGDDYHWRGKYYAHFFTPEEIRKSVESVGMNVVEMVGLEGLATANPDAINELSGNKRAWENWIEIHRLICTHPAVVGISAHILVVGKKPRRTYD